jgi:hypothetical protein
MPEDRRVDPVAPPQDTLPVVEDPKPEPTTEDQALALQIDPTWGIQKIFQHYRAALNALNAGPARDRSEIATFRQVNIDVERRLRDRLSGRMRQIDAIYQARGLQTQ